ncbi:hypothetical protein tb265_47310 [Gemmatimonadetes bacterium T265]|nr:hypothetical protein tb265_47310 [Gemmatimonadetes bacterium T265]
MLAAPTARAQYTVTAIGVPGAVNTSTSGINAAAQIVGEYNDAAGVHGFLATPAAATVPEPGALALVAAGLGVLGVVDTEVVH